MSNYEIFVYGWIAIGFLSFPFILSYDAPYGRHTSNNWGPLVDNKIGWIVMELPALIVCPLLVLSSGNPLGPPAVCSKKRISSNANLII